jgi:hypothetical protein
MNGWSWSDPRWPEWTGADPENLFLEALRRAVDIRDRNAEGANLSARPVVLVDVLNALGQSLRGRGSDIWDGSDLWNHPRFGEGYDEATFWARRSENQA